MEAQMEGNFCPLKNDFLIFFFVFSFLSMGGVDEVPWPTVLGTSRGARFQPQRCKQHVQQNAGVCV